MDVKQTKRTLKGLGPRKSVLIRGPHGTGKSQVVAQTCAELSIEKKKPYQFVDVRLSQREVGDIIGMPRGVDTFDVTRTVYKDGKQVTTCETIKNTTIHDLPHWFPQDQDSCGILFIDELDRATRDVQQAAFEAVLDYRMNFHEIPIGWRVVAAINGNQDIYSVIQLDPALLDRFLVIDFKPTVPEWLVHAKEIGVHDAIVKYITKFTTDLDSPEKLEPMTVYPSRRSWVALSDGIRDFAVGGDDLLNDLDYLTLFAAGYLGSTTSLNFVEYVRKDYKVFSAEDILNKLNEDMLKDFGAMLVTEMAFYNKEIVGFLVKEKMKTLNKKQGDNLLKYYKAIPKEAASGFWGQLTKENREVATHWHKNTPGVAEYTASLIYKDAAMKS